LELLTKRGWLFADTTDHSLLSGKKKHRDRLAIRRNEGRGAQPKKTPIGSWKLGREEGFGKKG